MMAAGRRSETDAAGNAECRDEDVEQHDKIQQVGSHMLPEGYLSNTTRYGIS